MGLAELYLKTLLFISKDGELISIKDFLTLHASPLYVITGWNPGDQRVSKRVNLEKNNQIENILLREGFRFERGIGKDPDSDYFEESFFIYEISQERAIELGREFEQVARFRVAHGSQMVIGCFEEWSLSRNL